jgi:thioredoxin-dependent peroxiredoxin
LSRSAGRGPARIREAGGEDHRLSVDATGDHEQWAKDIEETQGATPQYLIIGDSDFNVAKLHGMLPASTSGHAKSRTPADNQTVRNVFVIGPDKKSNSSWCTR